MSEAFRGEYESAFRRYAAAEGKEAGLGQAWELGKRAVTDGLSVLDVAEVHQSALVSALAEAESAADAERMGRAGKEFLIESLSTFEMTQRGFREAQEEARVNALLYEREHEIAQTLQRSLLPPRLPDIKGVEASASFRPAGEGNEVGGDFYDLFEAGEGAWAIAIGDVCGKGAEAAAVTALARYTLRATALHERRPSRVLALLNEALLRHEPADRFCTVIYAVFESDGAGHGRVELAVGGHPAPLVVRANGQVEKIGVSGSVLGVLPDPHLVDQSIRLDPGDTLLLYTDGVTEAQAPERILGANDVAAAIEQAQPHGPAAVVRCVEDTALANDATAPRDDIAILALTMVGDRASAPAAPAPAGAPAEMRVRLPAELQAAAEARRSLEPLERELGRGLSDCVRLLVNELVTNSLRHANLVAGDEIDLGVWVSADRVRVEVSDSGASFRPRQPAPHPSRESGWGLYLLDRLADSWGVDREDGTRVWFEVEREPVPSKEPVKR
jgi:serine phosphatase RsbU (regulator of sigma subunit)/anti-sigma regulatory factor (Ser/Thr protein kinase)